jgi:hypothetical protein
MQDKEKKFYTITWADTGTAERWLATSRKHAYERALSCRMASIDHEGTLEAYRDSDGATLYMPTPTNNTATVTECKETPQPKSRSDLNLSQLNASIQAQQPSSNRCLACGVFTNSRRPSDGRTYCSMCLEKYPDE